MLTSSVFYMSCISAFMLILFTWIAIKSKLSNSQKTTLFFSLIFILVFYWIAFGDLISTILAHKKYCEEEAGFKIYMSREQWEEENPGAFETSMPYTTSYEHMKMINNRFSTDFKLHLINGVVVRKQVESLIDLKTQQVLAENIDFSRGYAYYDPQSGNSLKVWLNLGSCHSIDRARQIGKEKNEFFQKFRLKWVASP